MERISKEDKSIVIGGGIAGLLASRVLSDHFTNVVLIEKDHYPKNAGPCNGTPQANHVHVLLMKVFQDIKYFISLEISEGKAVLSIFSVRYSPESGTNYSDIVKWIFLMSASEVL
jgi:hypothetical protein